MTDWDAKMADAMLDEHAEAEVIDETLAEKSEGVAMPSAPIQPLHVVVVGSAAWDEPLLVQAALLSWANHHGGQPVILWTTGAPVGAELEAREFAHRSGWRAAESTPELLLEMDATVVFGFVTPDGEARELLETIATRRPVRLLTLATLQPKSRWSRW